MRVSLRSPCCLVWAPFPATTAHCRVVAGLWVLGNATATALGRRQPIVSEWATRRETIPCQI